MKKLFYLLLLLLFSSQTFAQSVTIDPKASTNGSSIIKAQSPTAGILIPTMTSAQRSLITSPPKGLLVYDTDTYSIWISNGFNWINTTQWEFYTAGGIGNKNATFITLSAPVTEIINGYLRVQGDVRVFGDVGVGTGFQVPDARLHVKGDQVNSNIAKFESLTSCCMYMTLFENGQYRGYLGSYSGNAEDVDFGTGSGNNTGSLHLTIQTSPKLTINPLGNVGIGLTTPSTPLHVKATGIDSYTLTNPFNTWNSQNAGTFIKSGGNSGVSTGVIGACTGTGGGFSSTLMIGVAGIGNGGNNTYGLYGSASGGTFTNYGVYCSGSGGYTGTWSSLSDAKFKNNVVKLEDGIVGKIMQLKPSSYTFKTQEYKFMNLSEGTQFGFLAQELEQIFPTLVANASHPDEEGINGKQSSVSYKSVNYIGLIPILTKAIQEQATTISDLKSEIESLRKDFLALKTSLGK